MQTDIKSEIDNIFTDLEKDFTVGILIHPSPDPDCLGAAAGMAALLKEIYCDFTPWAKMLSLNVHKVVYKFVEEPVSLDKSSNLFFIQTLC